MKILIIGFAKIKYMPYINFYLDNIDREKNDVHIIYWNRDLQEENLDSLKGITLHEFKNIKTGEVILSIYNNLNLDLENWKYIGLKQYE